MLVAVAAPSTSPLACSGVPSAAPQAMAWRCDETAADLFAEIESPPMDLLPPLSHLRAGQALEILGEPGTGKSALLNECALRCILPRPDGHAAQAVVVDTGAGFSVNVLEEGLRRHFRARGGGDAACSEQAEAATSECMERVRVLPCYSANDLLFGLKALGRMSARRSSRQPDRPDVLLIDSLSEFQWLDRAQSGAVGGRSFETQLATQMRALLKQNRLAAVWTRSPFSTALGGTQWPTGGNEGPLSALRQSCVGLCRQPAQDVGRFNHKARLLLNGVDAAASSGTFQVVLERARLRLQPVG